MKILGILLLLISLPAQALHTDDARRSDNIEDERFGDGQLAFAKAQQLLLRLKNGAEAGLPAYACPNLQPHRAALITIGTLLERGHVLGDFVGTAAERQFMKDYLQSEVRADDLAQQIYADTELFKVGVTCYYFGKKIEWALRQLCQTYQAADTDFADVQERVKQGREWTGNSPWAENIHGSK